MNTYTHHTSSSLERDLLTTSYLLTVSTFAKKNEQMSWRHLAEGEADVDDPLSGEEGFEGVWGEQGQPHPSMATGMESGADEHEASRGGGFAYLDAVEPTARWAERAVGTIEGWTKVSREYQATLALMLCVPLITV